MQTVTTLVPRDADTCWRVFIDVAKLTSWVPGLRHAETIAKERGLPSEVHFQFAHSLAYTLVYTYDRENREVRWEPKLGVREGVTGFVRFEPAEGGTRVTYALEHGAGRGPAVREIGDLQRLVDAFATWLTTTT
jgi:uncharacterized membrane protein